MMITKIIKIKKLNRDFKTINNGGKIKKNKNNNTMFMNSRDGLTKDFTTFAFIQSVHFEESMAIKMTVLITLCDARGCCIVHGRHQNLNIFILKENLIIYSRFLVVSLRRSPLVTRLCEYFENYIFKLHLSSSISKQLRLFSVFFEQSFCVSIHLII